MTPAAGASSDADAAALVVARAAEASARAELAAVPEWLWDGRTLPVPVEHLADSRYGLHVEESRDLRRRAGLEPGTSLSGLLLSGERRIVVNAQEASESPGRRRFTITHEVGHWVLHHRPDEASVYCRSVSVREAEGHAEAAAPAAPEAGAPRPFAGMFDYPHAELEANQFAAAVLMPRELIAAYPRPGTQAEVDEVAAVFGVSRAALGRRWTTLEQGF